MSTNELDDLDDARLERLLSGTEPDRTDPVASVLAAASAPPSADELAGERSIMVAFSRANAEPGRRTLLTRLGKLLASKAAAIVLVTSAAGGAAFAAGGGITNPFNDPGAGATPTETSPPARQPVSGDVRDAESSTRRAEVEPTRTPADSATSETPDSRPTTAEPTPGSVPTGKPRPTDPAPRDPAPNEPAPDEPSPVPVPTPAPSPSLPSELPVPSPDLPEPDLPDSPQPRPTAEGLTPPAPGAELGE